MTTCADLKLVTKADAAAIFSVCVKSIDNYIREGRLPPPVQFASKEYWHPEDFRSFLERTFKRLRAAGDIVELADGASERPEHLASRTTVTAGGKDSNASVRQRTRQTALLKRLNANG